MALRTREINWIIRKKVYSNIGVEQLNVGLINEEHDGEPRVGIRATQVMLE